MNFETSSGRTPLIEAAKAGHLGVAKLLVKFGAVVEYVPRHRKTAIDHADWAGHQASSACCGCLLHLRPAEQSLLPSQGRRTRDCPVSDSA